ncbi:MAG: membrane protein insertion efficiency factor YidD [Microbacteriaceae bacterium]|nr:membrane protein insertion efficiency factor YidD [Microbacteriaceae bacterium]
MRTLALNLWVLPRNIPILFILLWRKAISPLYGNVCRYHPSCSAYGLGSIQQHGITYGSALTIWRILRCNPFSKGGVDDVRPGPKWITLTKVGLVFVKSAESADR